MKHRHLQHIALRPLSPHQRTSALRLKKPTPSLALQYPYENRIFQHSASNRLSLHEFPPFREDLKTKTFATPKPSPPGPLPPDPVADINPRTRSPRSSLQNSASVRPWCPIRTTGFCTITHPRHSTTVNLYQAYCLQRPPLRNGQIAPQFHSEHPRAKRESSLWREITHSNAENPAAAAMVSCRRCVRLASRTAFALLPASHQRRFWMIS